MTRSFLLLAIDISMTFLAGVIALFIRLGFNWQELSIYFPSIPIYTLIASIVYILNGTYRV
ncbi:MAG: polysaccharide biosynthesis protein, partial [Thermotogae bacterium]